MNNNTCKKIVIYWFCLVSFLMASVNAYGLGVAAINVDSYIGSQLDAQVIIFNVKNPQQLKVNFSSEDEETTSLVNRLELSISLSKSNNQLSVKIHSEQLINEPYLRFTLVFNDQGTIVNKEFIALLDLSPSSNANLGDSITQLSSNSPQLIDTGSNYTGNGFNTMGPYDWADSNNIPDRFGAVLDGQSLWRVARRINKALGVSINQMMWALYVANPDAFATKSVDSLKAGSYLEIPKFALASKISDSQAQQKIDQLSGGSASRQQIAIEQNEELETVVLNEVEVITDVDEVGEEALVEDKPAVAAEPFRLSAITSAHSETDDVLFADKENAQQVITSLATTVGNLTQELISKDKRIQFLEEKVAALEGLQAIKIDSQIVNAEPITDPVLPLDELDSMSESEPTINNEASDSPIVIGEDKERRSWAWLIIASVLLLFASIIYFLREKLAELWDSLGFFSEDEDVEFAPSTVEYINGKKPAINDTFSENKDFSTLSAVQKHLDAGNTGEVIEYDEFSYYSESDHESMSVEISDLEFEDRFNHLVLDKDYDFAKELLDFAKNNEIDEQEYGYYRLKLYEAMKDEQGFYNYYYEIESGLPSYELDLQTKISELVVAIDNH